MNHDKIAVVDFGGQYAHLIATKVRKAHVLAEIRQPDDAPESFADCRGVILSGSPSLASHGEDADWAAKGIFDTKIPVLGFCFGHQEIARHYGGEVVHGGREWGAAQLHVRRDHPLFNGVGETTQVWMSHFDSVATLGGDFEELGYTTGPDGTIHSNAAIGSDSQRRWGFQFHPEVDATIGGDRMIANFVLDICGCRPTWDMQRYLEEELEKVRAQIGDGSVFLLASGGVDSTVAAKLFALALPAGRLKLLHVDNGLMRKDESVQVVQMLSELGLGEALHFVDASEDFLEALEDRIQPERKRRAIGDTFVAVFEREARRLGIEDHLLGQGTIYPDTIETGGTKRAHIIKTHHNRVPLIEQMISEGRVVEPLAELYKVEVRELATQLGVPHDMIWRHPFPGPGLGVRLLCSDGNDEAPDVAAELERICGPLGVAALALPVKSVGVKADLRSYEHPVMITAPAGTSWEEILEAARQVLKYVPGINRCVWNLGPAAPQAMQSVAGAMTRDRLDLLREADHLVMEGLHRHGLYRSIWQCPTAMVPLRIDGRGEELVIVRPVHSERAMTARPAELPTELLDELRRDILTMEGVSGLALDLTSKPPGTIEWE